ncbi:MAG: HD domain-containing phosphohydrolase [Deferribacterales bacterium]|jgi:response regulator RpfG family c-di-GMP phosphodiesterase
MSHRFKVVSVDDNKLNLMLIESMLSSMNVEIFSFMKPVEAMEFCDRETADLMLIDYMMPEMDGIEFISKIREEDQEVPIIMITAVDDDDSVMLRALEAGATEFLNKPLKLYEFQVRVKNLLTIRKNQILLKDRATLLQMEVDAATEEIIQRERETLAVLGRASEFKDTETGAHICRVAKYAKLIGSVLIDEEEELDMLYYSSPLHDVGKIGISDDILLKPGALDPEQRKIMDTHTNIGYKILSDTKSKYLQGGAIIAKTHHERWDGTGYPEGLKGVQIPLIGRIVAVCDVFDALLSDRPYKVAWDFETSVKYIKDNSGKMFDPSVVNAFFEKIAEIREVYETYKD